MITNRMRLGLVALLVMVLSLSAPFGAAAAGNATVSSTGSFLIVRAPNIVSRISFAPRSPNVLKVNEAIALSFHYNTNSSLGTIVTATPFTGTTATASATVCKTAVLAGPSGTGSCNISVSVGNVAINSIHIQMWDSTQKIILWQAVLPVNYFISNAGTMVNTVAFSPASADIRQIGKGVSVSFNYQTNQTAGVRIIAVPFTGTAATPNYASCFSVVYPVGSGTGSCRFTIISGATAVTSVHMEIWDSLQTKMLAQEVFPVLYRFVAIQPTMLTNVSVPAKPNIFRLGDKVYVHFDYATNQTAGVIVDVIPFTGTTATAGAISTPSLVLPSGTGKGSCAFTISGPSTAVTSVKVRVWDSTHKTLLSIISLPVMYWFQ